MRLEVIQSLADPAAVTDLLDDLVERHRRVRHGFAAMRARGNRSNDGVWQANADERWLRVRRQLLDCARAVLTTIPQAELERQRDVLVERLGNGWKFAPADREAQAEADALFSDILDRYEALCDVLNGLPWLDAEIARMTRLVAAARQGTAARRAARPHMTAGTDGGAA